MSDELLTTHLSLLGSSSIPLSYSPPWLSIQYRERSLNLTAIVLPQTLSETRDALHSAEVKWSAFFDVAPRWSIFAFGSAPVLRFATRAASVSSGVELVRMSGDIDAHARFEVVVDENGAAFLGKKPAERRLLDRERVVVAMNGSQVCGGACVLGDEGGCLITTIWLEGGLHGRNAIGLGVGKQIVVSLLKAIAEAVDGEIWIHANLEETEVLEAALELGWRINRNWWKLEGSKAEEEKHRPSGGGWELSDWGKGMKGWKDEWIKALEKI